MDLPKPDIKSLQEMGLTATEVSKLITSLALINSQLVYQQISSAFTLEELEAIDQDLAKAEPLTDEKRMTIVDEHYRRKIGKYLVETAQEKLVLLVKMFIKVAKQSRLKAKEFLELSEEKQKSIATAIQAEKWDEVSSLWPH